MNLESSRKLHFKAILLPLLTAESRVTSPLARTGLCELASEGRLLHGMPDLFSPQTNKSFVVAVNGMGSGRVS